MFRPEVEEVDLIGFRLVEILQFKDIRTVNLALDGSLISYGVNEAYDNDFFNCKHAKTQLSGLQVLKVLDF